MIRYTFRFPRLARLAAILISGALPVLSVGAAFAYYGYVRGPLAYSATVTQDWGHAQGYGERALDLSSNGTSVYAYLENPSSTDYLYYEVSDYKASQSDCPGTKLLLYDHTPGGQYIPYGRVNYVHLADQSAEWGHSYNINPGQSKSWYTGYTIASCDAPVHLHFGHSLYDSLTEYYTGGVGGTVSYGQLTMYH